MTDKIPVRAERMIKSVLRRGLSANGSFFRIKFFRQLPADKSHFKIIVGKKVSNLATTRNRIRRRSRAVFEEVLRGVGGFSIIVFPSFEVKDAPFDQLRKDAEHCLKKLLSG